VNPNQCAESPSAPNLAATVTTTRKHAEWLTEMAETGEALRKAAENFVHGNPVAQYRTHSELVEQLEKDLLEIHGRLPSLRQKAAAISSLY
jgi:hypothetical protein